MSRVKLATLTMRTLSDNNCLTCLLKMDRDSVQGTHTMDMELKRLLMQHLKWQQEELSAELLPKQLCTSCYQQLINFEQFQQQAGECRQQLLVMLQESKMQTANFEIVYEEESPDNNDDEQQVQQQELLATASINSDDPFDEPTQGTAPMEETGLRRRCKGVKNSF